ncbi:hypothetical protein LV35_04260 [Acinetobacter baumannii]|uniref:Uncharacterized protein n=1 Tax=Acinetobacter baumannii TaxID=470 RepID=A0AAJ0VM99_ACIBA|nr:hypothetical protein LV35_04260 [Acinetobacter baumannii]
MLHEGFCLSGRVPRADVVIARQDQAGGAGLIPVTRPERVAVVRALRHLAPDEIEPLRLDAVKVHLALVIGDVDTPGDRVAVLRDGAAVFDDWAGEVPPGVGIRCVVGVARGRARYAALAARGLSPHPIDRAPSVGVCPASGPVVDSDLNDGVVRELGGVIDHHRAEWAVDGVGAAAHRRGAPRLGGHPVTGPRHLGAVPDGVADVNNET